MKKIVYSIIFLCSLLVGCQENEMNTFDNEGAVYFQLNATNWSDMSDSIVYSFAGKDEMKVTLNLQVDLMGEAVDYDREICLIIDQKLTTAKEGVHYQALETSYILPAGAYTMQIPVTILGSDPDLEKKMVQLALQLKASNDLALGLSQRTLARVQFSSVLTMPYYWEEFLWGKYSRVKHEKLIELFGVDFPAAEDEYREDFSTWNAYCNALSQYFDENYPINDEHGNPIDPWYVY